MKLVINDDQCYDVESINHAVEVYFENVHEAHVRHEAIIYDGEDVVATFYFPYEPNLLVLDSDTDSLETIRLNYGLSRETFRGMCRDWLKDK